MKTTSNGRHHSILTQLFHNRISWIGHFNNDPNIKKAGQVFACPDKAEVDRIEVFSDMVQHPGTMQMTLHRFDDKNNTWGPIIAAAERDIQLNENARWISFDIPPVSLEKNQNYGFILSSADAFVALGEAAWPNNTDHHCGQEWTADDHESGGRFYDHFSLAYKLDARD
ncbi:MAG: hypothetical protein GC171_06510 [Terrimonas sp.]|nr:hypothetical protein [Terrimonas sp.]